MRSHRVLITGSNGSLGQHLAKYYLNSEDKLLATSYGQNRISALENNYQTLDITNYSNVKSVIDDFRPDIIFNTAAATDVDGCEDEHLKCDSINNQGVQNFVKAFEELSVTPHFVQISTDFIFDGEQEEYAETDEPNPVSEYGRSKWLGEQAILESNYGRYTIIRTSLVYGVGEVLNKGNIFLWAMSKLRENQVLTIVNDQFRTPTYVKDLSKACIKVAEKQYFGMLNIAGAENLSMYDYIIKVANYLNKDNDLITAISSDVLSQKAKRPMRSGLNIDKARRLIDYNPTKFEDSLREMDTLS
jgi:dTDP-4-dehydrorhamnose reductase